jgi:hypothetical protein
MNPVEVLTSTGFELYIELYLSALLEAITTIDRFAGSRFKRHRGLFTTGSADYRILLAAAAGEASPFASGSLAGLSATGTTGRFVLETFFSIKILFRSREEKLVAAITAG